MVLYSFRGNVQCVINGSNFCSFEHSSLSCTDGHCDSGQCGFGFYSVVLSKMSRSDAERYRRLVHQDLFVFDVGMIGRTACKCHEVMRLVSKALREALEDMHRRTYTEVSRL